MSTRYIVLLLLGLCLESTVAHAQADPPPSPAPDPPAEVPSPPPAPPKSTPTAADLAEARRLFRSGARAYDAGRFDVAVRAFDQAYDLAPRSSLRFSAAQALRRLYALDPDPAHLRRALVYFRQYLAEVKEGRRVKDAAEAVNAVELTLAQVTAPEVNDPATPVSAAISEAFGTLDLNSAPAGAVARVAGRPDTIALPTWIDLPGGEYEVTVEAPGFVPKTRKVRLIPERVTVIDASLEEQPAALALEVEAGCDVVVDGKAAGRTPLLAPLRLASGSHRIVVGKAGRRAFGTTVNLSRGESRTLTIDLGMTAQRGVAWGFLSTAAAASVTGIVLVLMTVGRRTDAAAIELRREQEQRDLSLAEAVEHNDLLDTAQNLTGFAVVSLITAGLAGGVGLTLYVLDAPDLYEAEQAGDAHAVPPSPQVVVAPLIDVGPATTTVGITLRGHF